MEYNPLRRERASKGRKPGWTEVLPCVKTEFRLV
jgi:hypothetical protein